jgi:hypothetical protein
MVFYPFVLLHALRHEAWAMFDHGYSGYLHYAFPKDNLMPMSCKGKDWQGQMCSRPGQWQLGSVIDV